MRRFLNPFMLLFTALIFGCYIYASSQLTPLLVGKILFLMPFIAVWLVPLLYWFGDQAEMKPWSHKFQSFAYLSMGWLNFLFFALIPLNIAMLLIRAIGRPDTAAQVTAYTPDITFAFSFLALSLGFWRARRGPSVRVVGIPHASIPEALHGLKIAQISDLHIGPTIHKSYVEHVVTKANGLDPDIIVLTGDIVDGTIAALGKDAAPLANLRAKHGVYLILGNHDYYSGAEVWVAEFRRMGIRVLLNQHAIITADGTAFMLAGVLDPAVRGFSKELKPDASLARGIPEASKNMFRILLAHNPKLAAEAARAGFHLQISGHTHAGQFIPWTWVVKMVHKPHYAGLSEEAGMAVYVSAGTGSWGPPLRLGTSPELTLLKLSEIKPL